MTKLVKITASLLICLKTKIKLKSSVVLESKGKERRGREGGNYVAVQFYPCFIIDYHIHTKAKENSQIEPQHLMDGNISTRVLINDLSIGT